MTELGYKTLRESIVDIIRKRIINREFDMLPSYRTMKYKSPIWGYFHVQKE